MNEYQKYLEQFKQDLQRLSEQTISDIRDILMDKSIVYQYKRTNEDIVVYLFEYDFELLDLTFYGLDKNLSQYTEHISIPSKFPEKDWKTITRNSIYSFESEKTMKRYDDNVDQDESRLYDSYFDEKNEAFENWFFDCWKEASQGIELQKGMYFSIHDTGDRIDLSTMTEVSEEEIVRRLE
ncbi:hypothetical protein [Sphingobacterium yanglingense]|uniref:Uncharacterized protein n=1 Tax=Sphingobacterium yanglingense TaxID=1437280 RepID=A0A4R6WJI1_9SPHI|nr:hypothetical protein [Sphingobacterium yanglingense]TDQ77890.1 hypothetical protein CLV99_1859 [Sphingobacterium yanglingense]